MGKNNYTKTFLASFILAFTGSQYSAHAQEAAFSADAMFMAEEGLAPLNTNEGDDLFSLLESTPGAKDANNQKAAPGTGTVKVAPPAANAPKTPKAEAKPEQTVPPMFPDTSKAPAAKDAPQSKPAVAANPEKPKEAEAPASDSETASFPGVDIFSEQLSFPEVTGASSPAAKTTEKTTPSEQLLGTVDTDVFREMAAIERENALLTLRAKREKLLSEIESSKAQQRKNQLDELERREVITRNRINWEIEQETAAQQREKEKEREKLLGTSLPNGEKEEDITLIYKVEEVRGVDGDLYAVLIYDQGSKINVREGYVLKNGYKISKISTALVEVKRGDETALLAFANKNDVDSGTYSSPMGIR